MLVCCWLVCDAVCFLGLVGDYCLCCCGAYLVPVLVVGWVGLGFGVMLFAVVFRFSLLLAL